MSPYFVVVIDELSDLVVQIVHRAKRSKASYLRTQHSEPDLNLIEPRTVLGQEVKMNSVKWVTQERLPRCLILENSVASFFAQFRLVNFALLGNVSHAGFAVVSVQVVGNDAKACCGG